MPSAQPLRRYPHPTAEDLPRLARTAYGLAGRHCTACRDYHVMWPYLRSLGLHGGGPEHRFAEQHAAFAAAARGRKAVRWLLAGSADAGQLALVGSVAALDRAVLHRVTIVDRCATPLGVARSHAEAAGLGLETVLGDLMAFDAPGAFDVVSMHHVVNFFPEELRLPFLRHAATWLAPDGRILIAVNHVAPGATVKLSEALRTWREAGIREAAATGRLDLPEDLETFVRRLDGMRDSRKSAQQGGHDRGYYETLASEAGLEIVDIVSLPFDDDERALHGGHPRERCIMVAAAPGHGHWRNL
ncbi:MAG: class I SAM-dependent methyltransferase [Bauldia sp.]|nr:class I SAM-dependent methyltransferase [Bauldia sp.]